MRRGGVVALILAMAACAPPSSWAQAVSTEWQDLPIEAAPVEINAPAWLGDGRELRFAGGVELRAAGPVALRELSDLKARADGRLLAVGDEGELIEFRPVLDDSGRLVGVEGGRIRHLMRPDGQPVRGKLESDAEGLAIFPDGRFLVSFERRHRIWLYPADGGRPVVAPSPSPDAILPENQGFESLSAVGQDGYRVAAEFGGMWICRLATACVKVEGGYGRPDGEATSSFDADPGADQLFVITRRSTNGVPSSWALLRYEAPDVTRASLQARTLLAIDRDSGVDANFEGIAVVRREGGLRLYIVSDDAQGGSGRTLLLAFDWDRP